MKKITFIAILILMAGLLIGCATTSETTSTKNKNSYNKDAAWEEEFWNKDYWKMDRPKDCYLAWSGKTNEEVTEIMKDKFYEILNSSEITADDWFVINTILELRNISKGFQPEQWFSDFVKDKEKSKQHNSYNGIIKNDTDTILRLGLMYKTNTWAHWYYIEIPAHEEKDFTVSDLVNIPDEEKLDFTYMCIKHPKYWYLLTLGTNDIDTTYATYMKYLFDNYSLVFSFDENELFQTNSGGSYHTRNWKFVKRIESDVNTLKEVDYDSTIAVIFGKYR